MNKELIKKIAETLLNEYSIGWWGGGHDFSEADITDVCETITEVLEDYLKWYPIATVPKDRYVLLFTPDAPRWDGNMEVGKWFGDCFWSSGGPNGGLEIEQHWTYWSELPDDPI